jgi:inner membrane transporter RhtA
MMIRSSVALAVLFLVVAMASIQVGASIAKGLFPIMGAEGVSALRLGFAALILVAIFRPWRTRLSRNALGSLVAYGLALGAMNLCFYLAIRTIPLGIAVALEFTGPLAIAVLMSRKPVDFLWAGLAVLGLLMLIPADPLKGPLDPTGVVLALAAGACWAAYILFGQRAGAEHGMQTTALGMVIAAVVVAPLAAVRSGEALLAVEAWPLFLALMVAVLSSALPYSLEMFALTKLPAHTFGALMSVEPAMAALTGYLVLSETLTAWQWLAVLSVIIASAGAAVTAARARPTQPPT